MKRKILTKKVLVTFIAITILAVGMVSVTGVEFNEPVLKYQMTWDAQLPATIEDGFDWWGINWAGGLGVTIGAGDTLVYDMYIPSDGNYVPGFGFIDVQEATSWKWLWQTDAQMEDGTIKDKNGDDLLGDMATIHGYDKWITREFVLPSEFSTGGLHHVGPYAFVNIEDTTVIAGKTTVVYFRNIYVKKADETMIHIYGPEKEFEQSYFIHSDLNDIRGTVLLEEVAAADDPTPTSAPDTVTPGDAGFLLYGLAALIGLGGVSYSIRKRK